MPEQISHALLPDRVVRKVREIRLLRPGKDNNTDAHGHHSLVIKAVHDTVFGGSLAASLRKMNVD